MFTLKLQLRETLLISSLSMMCVTHPASCLAGLLDPSEIRDLFMPPLKEPHDHASFPPILPLPRMPQAALPWTAWLDSLSDSEIASSYVGGKGGSETLDILQNSCGTRPGHCHLPFHYLSFEGS